MKRFAIVDANEAVASVAYRLSETIAIYPITPSSAMAEWCDIWSAKNQANIWGTTPRLVQMQSEAGVAGAIHGMLQAGALSTTFTASQGLLLMIPNLYKIAGELLPLCLHVTARAVATHALSIFGDHSDVMACRQTGVAMLASNSVQEAQDFACIAHAAALAGRVPFLHFFDGFRTSHEVTKIHPIGDEILRAMIDENWVTAFRSRSLDPEHPFIRGTAQNPDVFFQGREAANRFYEQLPGIVGELMVKFGELTGRFYQPCQYEGHPQADRVIIAMGSGAETVEETVRHLNLRGARTGVLKVRLYRPFSAKALLDALPETVRKVAVLDRTKEPGSSGEPLYLDILSALSERRERGNGVQVIGGRYGLSSKEFDPAMVKAIFEELGKEQPRREFTVGINDDVTGLSLVTDPDFTIEPPETYRAVFFGLGSDGTVGANKNSIKILGEKSGRHVQAYFVYDSKKSGAMTVSHLRFGPQPIGAHYLIKQANFVACHHFQFLEHHDICGIAGEGATVLLNSALPPARVWSHLPGSVQRQMVEKRLRLFIIDAGRIAAEAGLGGRINTVMQTCFFALVKVVPTEQAEQKIKDFVQKTYGRKSSSLVQQNFAAIDAAVKNLVEIPVPGESDEVEERHAFPGAVPPSFVQRVTSIMLAGQGDQLPVSAFTPDGTWPVGTSKWEKRNIADAIPIWEPDLCIQCNKCALVCPHASIRPKFFSSHLLKGAPVNFRSVSFRSREFPDNSYTLQVAPEDCTGCSLCVQVCPVKDKKAPGRKAINMQPQAPWREIERENFAFFLDLPVPDRAALKADVKGSQFCEPLFEYSGACSGCGETPYLKLLTQLFGDRLVIANATGCSSIYGGNLPTTPYTCNAQGRGPAWSNSLFEDNAEYGLGIRFAIDKQNEIARELLRKLAGQVGGDLAESMLKADQRSESDFIAQRERIALLRQRLAGVGEVDARRLEAVADALLQRSVWLVGGDGWAYDIDFGGLDHVFSLGRNVNILVLDTEVYSNTGGQQSKATPFSAKARFATAGKTSAKKNLGLMAMNYGSVYVAQVALGAKDSQTLKAFEEAAKYDGTSLIIANSHCIAHGYPICRGLDQQKLAVDTGSWVLYRYDPRRTALGLPAFQLDSSAPKIPVAQYLESEPRFLASEKGGSKRGERMRQEAQRSVDQLWAFYEGLAEKNGRG